VGRRDDESVAGANEPLFELVGDVGAAHHCPRAARDIEEIAHDLHSNG
jgi:hypothetical protein